MSARRFAETLLEVVLALDDRTRTVGTPDEVDHRGAVRALVHQHRARLDVGIRHRELLARRVDVDGQKRGGGAEAIDLGLGGVEAGLRSGELGLETTERGVIRRPLTLVVERWRPGPAGSPWSSPRSPG